MRSFLFLSVTIVALLSTGSVALAASSDESRIVVLEETVRTLERRIVTLEDQLREQTTSRNEPRRVPVTTTGAIISRPNVEDFYPRDSKRAGEQGRVRIKICHDTSGHVVDSTVDQSSGFPRLDQAAVRMGYQYRLRPGTEDGVSVADCTVVPITFMLGQ